jgi:hypothetical protein
MVGCSDEQERVFDLPSGSACPPDAGPQVCSQSGGAAGGSSAQPDPEPEDDNGGDRLDADFVFGGLEFVNGFATLIISNCPAGSLCRSAPFEVRNDGDGAASIVISDPTREGAVLADCGEAIAPGQSCQYIFEVERPSVPGNTLCLGRLSMTRPVSGQEVLPVCLETFFGECPLQSCQ